MPNFARLISLTVGRKKPWPCLGKGCQPLVLLTKERNMSQSLEAYVNTRGVDMSSLVDEGITTLQEVLKPAVLGRQVSTLPGCASWGTVHEASFRPLDRKSTRLNSSHSQISYAVFCLKKKKQKQHVI